MTIKFDSVLFGIMWKTILDYFTLICMSLSTVLYSQLYLTIRLRARDFYAVIVDSGEIEIGSE